VGKLVTISAQPVVAGFATAPALVSEEPLSFWGGFDPDRGVIIDRHHPLEGMNAAGHTLVIPAGRGSCSGSGTLLEAIRNATAPAAIVLGTVDPIIGLGAVLGEELYGIRLPVVVVSDADRSLIETGDIVTIANNGTITICGNCDV
jgi:predicted aconitase with swiveling domain